jgi:hypothetical protein
VDFDAANEPAELPFDEAVDAGQEHHLHFFSRRDAISEHDGRLYRGDSASLD